MSVYLHDIPLPEAQKQLEKALKLVGRWGILGGEVVALDENAIGRVLAEPVWAKISSPHYHAAAMDGFAVRSEQTAGAMPSAPLTLQFGTQTTYIDTGDPLPGWANAVIPIENVEPVDEVGQLATDPRKPAAIRIRSASPPWQHIRPLGEDIVASELVLPAGQVLRPVDLGAVAACGHDRILVARRPRVAIIPTGSELVSVGEPVRMGQIIEFNSLVLAGQINSWGGLATRLPITPDDFRSIQARVAQVASDHDLILLNAGSSAGSEDYSAEVVKSLGELLVHGVAVRPGHPVILGMVSREGGTSTAIPIIGVPGYPVSAALTGEIFVKPLLERWTGRSPSDSVQVKASLTRKVTSPAGDDDYMRVAVGRVGDQLLAAPLGRGAGVITSLVRADGIVILPRGSQGLSSGAEVTVNLLRPPLDLERTIFVIGSHDISLDLMAQFLAARNRRLTSANVGSLGGLVALERGQAHLAGSHLLDPETGEYNLMYIRQYLPEVAVRVIAFVGRQQGLLVQAGNPKKVLGLKDLTRSEVVFVNRQRGAGTRVLLDYNLIQLGIATEQVQGYDQEEYTHLSVAAAVASGRADCGLGIAAAAKALDLEFIPLFQERYDLVVPFSYLETDLLKPVFEVMQEPAFRQAVLSLPGYDIEPMGKIIADIHP